jgi:hypothetical protein
MQYDEEPDEGEQSEVVVKKGCDHGVAPPTCLEMGTLYPVLGAMELSADLGYTTWMGLIRLSAHYNR